ncbi:hypothetical protein BU24DRAFT_428992 [Aaosphaeria arxii CBS 175.79]|uniref:Uncharacterized protein n=1 Tax=Aaosphaeria arxii CBS 175.79 TaxID=1450172 RepID=A0A6A5X7Y6_9PLEO|nr:uncharacterized protein BU24DRAFT_428992 [Aaosphaeria arxii CBS 175.79]KAF2009040.1 hypothetical protein BU24DRAFT_428992 [Aaosphaeria arxii CBS 175.79]
MRVAIQRPAYASRPTPRSFFKAAADFTNIGSKGTLAKEKITIYIDGPEESYVCIPAEIGHALQAAARLINSEPSLPQRLDRVSLKYFDDSNHFALASSPDCPRLVIPQQLPRPSAANTSPATLYLYGVFHQIALDGTFDGMCDVSPHIVAMYAHFNAAEFAELASSIILDIGEALEKLRDM